MTTAAVRLRVDPVDLRDDLLEFLRASSCLGVKHGPNEIEVHLLNSVSERHDRGAPTSRVEAWKARHGGRGVQKLDRYGGPGRHRALSQVGKAG
jgi:hypothetical protein